MLDVDSLNRRFPKYPITVMDKGWVYGVWYCSTAWQKAPLYGMYPATFLKRVYALFPQAQMILHAPSGALDEPSLCLDRVCDAVRRPHVQACCGALPLKQDTFDLVLSDPPYSKADSVIYGCPPFPTTTFMREAHRILRPGGYFGMLHTSYPSYHRANWELVGLIAVVTGFLRATRMFSVFRVKK